MLRSPPSLSITLAAGAFAKHLLDDPIARLPVQCVCHSQEVLERSLGVGGPVDVEFSEHGGVIALDVSPVGEEILHACRIDLVADSRTEGRDQVDESIAMESEGADDWLTPGILENPGRHHVRFQGLRRWKDAIEL